MSMTGKHGKRYGPRKNDSPRKMVQEASWFSDAEKGTIIEAIIKQ